MNASAAVPELTKREQQLRNLRKGSYHLDASRNKLPHPDDPQEEEEDLLFKFLTEITPNKLIPVERQLEIRNAKVNLLRNLAKTSGDVSTPEFAAALDQLTKLYDPSVFDARKAPRKHSSDPKRGSRSSFGKSSGRPELEGMWLTLSRPCFEGCLGTNPDRHPMYTLGRMTFDMFRPTGLVCSIQGTFNPVHVIDGGNIEAVKNVPKSLSYEVRQNANVLRTYE